LLQRLLGLPLRERGGVRLRRPLPLTRATRGQKVFTLTGVLLGLFLAALDQTIVATAGPAIQADLQIPPALYPWLTTAYMVASTVMVPIWGKLSDQVGRRPVLIAGICVFLTGSVLCGLSASFLVLVLARAVQGLGAASLFTSAFAVLADLFPPETRGRYQGLLGACFAVASVVGPLVGGLVTDVWGWHWVFLVNLPVGLVALGFVVLRMPAPGERGEGRRIDFAGAAALAVAVVPLLLALSLGRTEEVPGQVGHAWSSPFGLGLLAASAVGFALFLVIERRAASPILDLQLFRIRSFAVSNAASFLVGSTFFASIVFLPLFMVNVVGLSATSAGLTLTPLTLGLVAGNVLSGQLVSALGRYRTMMRVFMALNVGAFALLAFTLGPDSTRLEITVQMVFLGLVLGPSIPMFTLISQNAVQARDVGVATAATGFFRALGGTVGLALFGTVFALTLAGGLPQRLTAAAPELPPAVHASLAEAVAQGKLGEGVQAFPREAIAARLAGSRPDAVVRLHGALRVAYAEATRGLYLWAVALALLGLAVTWLLPDAPLRAPAPPA
jgi:EmrB/QacA subfamily drug resistance transporter